MVLGCEMFCDAVTLGSLMPIDARNVLTGNIDCARVQQCIVPEKDFDQRLKVSRSKDSALQLAAVSRPVSAEPVNLTSRWTNLLVRNGQRTNHRPAGRGDKRSAFINENVQRLTTYQ